MAMGPLTYMIIIVGLALVGAGIFIAAHRIDRAEQEEGDEPYIWQTISDSTLDIPAFIDEESDEIGGEDVEEHESSCVTVNHSEPK